jgi:Arc/MetJ-type ribon-helix-helix transcriptional regulator
MKVELTPEAAEWVKAAMATGRFATAEEAIRYAIDRAKLSELRAELEAAEAEGGAFDSGEVKRFARERLTREGRTSDH